MLVVPVGKRSETRHQKEACRTQTHEDQQLQLAVGVQKHPDARDTARLCMLRGVVSTAHTMKQRKRMLMMALFTKKGRNGAARARK